MSEKEERLETALLETIERIAKEPMSEAEIQVLPQLAQVLLKLWNR